MTNIKGIIVSYTSIMAFMGMGLFTIPFFFNGADNVNATSNADAIIEVDAERSSDDNKAKAKKYYDIWNAGTWDKLDAMIADDYVSHSRLPGVTPDREGMKQWMASVKNAFPDVHFTVEQQVAEGDLVVTRWSAIGTHDGAFLGIPATGKKSKVTGISITRYENGLSVESWGEWDALGMMTNMGAIQPNKKEGGSH